MGRVCSVALVTIVVAVAAPLAISREEPQRADAETEKRIRELIDDLGDDGYEVRDQATATLIKMGKVVLPYVKDLVESDDPEVKMRAKRIVAEVSVRDRRKFSAGLESVFPDVYEKIGSGDSKAKFNVLLSVLKIDREDQTPCKVTINDVKQLIEELLTNGDGGLNEEQKVAICRIVAGEKFRIQNEEARWRAEIPEAVPAIAGLLQDDSETVRVAALYAISDVDAKDYMRDVTPKILPLLKDTSGEVRKWAVRTLGKHGDDDLLPVIKELLADRDASVQQEAKQAVELLEYRMKNPR